MSHFEYRLLEFARNEGSNANVYQCELSSDLIRITAGILPSLEVSAKLEDFVEVLVSHVESTAKFHVQLKENDVSDLQRKMSLVYANPSTLKPLSNPHRGQYCAIKSGDDQLWYRAVIVNRISPTQLEAYLVDYGGREKVVMANLKELHPECSLLPPQAIGCKLQDVEDKDDAELTKKFRDIVQNQSMVIRLNGKEDSALLATLYQVVGDSDFNVNDYLLGKGPAPPTLSGKVAFPNVVVKQPEHTATEATSAGRGTFESGQGSRNANLRSGGNGNGFRGGGRGGGNENRGTGFGDRPGGFGERPQNNFGDGRGNFRGNRGGDRGDRGQYGGNRISGGFGDRGGRFVGDSNTGHGSSYGGDRSGSFSGDSGRSYNSDRGRGRFTNERGGGSSGFSRGGTRSVGFTSSILSAGNNGAVSPKAPFTSNAVSGKPKIELVRPSLQVSDKIIGKIIQARSPYEFWVTTALVSGFNRLPDAMWDYAKTAGAFTPLKDASVGASCIMLAKAPACDHYPMYCRAVITHLNGNVCDLWLVDYAETKQAQAVDALFNVPAQFAELPWQAIKCKLDQAEEVRSQFDDQMKAKSFVDGVNQTDVSATVKGFDGEIAVVDVQVGSDKRDLLGICKSIADKQEFSRGATLAESLGHNEWIASHESCSVLR